MEEQDNKVPGMTPELLGLIHAELADIAQLKSLAPSEQRMLWQVPDSKWEDMDTASRCFTQMDWPWQAGSSAASPFGQQQRLRGGMGGHI